jgi:hypothetical protein
MVLEDEGKEQVGHDESSGKEANYGNERRQLKVGESADGVPRGASAGVAGSEANEESGDGKEHKSFEA